MIGSDFQPQVATKRCTCSECGKRIEVGETCFVSIKGDRVKKRVCSQDCAQEFDARIWDAFAQENDKKRRSV